MSITMLATASKDNWIANSAQLRKAVAAPDSQLVHWFVRPTSDWDLCPLDKNATVRQVLTTFKTYLDNYLNISATRSWGIGMSAESDKQWTCKGEVMPGSDFRYILFGGWNSVFPEEGSGLMLDIQGGGDQGYPTLNPDMPVSAVLQNGCGPQENHCAYPSHHLMEKTYEPYTLLGNQPNPNACKDMKSDQPLKCCDGVTVCDNEAGLSCKMRHVGQYSALMTTVLGAAQQQLLDKNVTLVPCVGAAASNADCALAGDQMLADSLSALPQDAPVCLYMGGL
eukprot:TRINITY_DN13208_c0_g1_i2.p1 TRINITY_DN13208_c0_g1~~TRINITY_DN13208_c0_g1_i2.p1  ORF type:complete len:281 (+),score=46.80 TRINITY_DN13208_c0_g1_i2:109-951(+)